MVYASVSCENGRSKGCGLVQFETVAEADAAIDTLNGVEFMGRTIQVREDIKNAQGPKRSRGAGLQTGSVLPKRRFEQDAGGDERHRLFISNLSFNTDWMMLKDHFKQVRESVPWEKSSAGTQGDAASKMARLSLVIETLRSTYSAPWSFTPSLHRSTSLTGLVGAPSTDLAARFSA